jgi:hypothetical protein
VVEIVDGRTEDALDPGVGVEAAATTPSWTSQGHTPSGTASMVVVKVVCRPAGTSASRGSGFAISPLVAPQSPGHPDERRDNEPRRGRAEQYKRLAGHDFHFFAVEQLVLDRLCGADREAPEAKGPSRFGFPSTRALG